MIVARRIESFARDEDGAHVAQLDCGHRSHIRHRPPLSFYPWIDDARLRADRIGSAIECERCARLELPDDVLVYEQTAVFDATTLPAGLRKVHTTKRGKVTTSDLRSAQRRRSSSRRRCGTRRARARARSIWRSEPGHRPRARRERS